MVDPLLATYLAHPQPLERRKASVVAVLRALVSLWPARAEGNWAVRNMDAGYPDDQWFEVHSPMGHVAYIQIGKSGRFSPTRPPDIRDADLAKLNEPAGPHFALREFLDTLAGRFKNEGEEQWSEKLRQLSPVLRAMGDGTFDSNEVKIFLWNCYELLRNGQSAVPYCQQYVVTLQRRYVDFFVPGYLVAYMQLLDRSWRTIPDRPTVDFTLTALNPSGLPADTTVQSVPDLVRIVFKTLVNTGEAQPVERGIKSMLEEGERWQRDAAVAPSVGDFYGRLYESCPCLYGAYRGYQLLADLSTDPNRQRRHKIDATACEELMLKSFVSLNLSAGDSVGAGYINRMRQDVADARKKEGDFSAELLTDQYIEWELLYPPFWRPYLLGVTSELPVRSTPAGRN